MSRVIRWMLVALATAGATVPATAIAGPADFAAGIERGRAKVSWTKIDVPGREDATKVAKQLRKLLDKAVRKADFGEVRKVSASVRVAELKTSQEGDVVRVSCTLVGTLQGGRSARSRISFGGDPKRVSHLEEEVLTMVANGLVTRLAELARAQHAAREDGR